MTGAHDLLVEIGAEELPPKALRKLSEAFATEIAAELDAAGFAHGAPVPYATPRRLAVLVPGVPGTQPDRDVERRGPPLAHAFDDKGAPTKAALGFAKSVGVEVDRLVRLETGAGAWLAHRFTETGATLASLLPGMLERALERLPAPRRMRWADRDTEFVRPVHWVVLMHGGEVVEAEILGVRSGRVTRGHRFHHDFRRTGGIALEDAGRYEAALRDEGRVVAGFETRMEIIREQVEREARVLGGRALIDPELLEENTALVEWPVAVAGHFDAAFLALPDAVLTATMQGHQRYFPVAARHPRESGEEAGGDGAVIPARHSRGVPLRESMSSVVIPADAARGGDSTGMPGKAGTEGSAGALMPHFIAVSNIASRDVETVRKGNERVIRPRLSDAAYFFDADRRRTLESRLDGLKDVVFQRKLGTLHAKAQRVSALAGRVAEAMGRSDRAAAGASTPASSPVDGRERTSAPRGGTMAGASALVTPTPAAPTATRVPAIAGTADDESQLPNGRPTGEALAADALASHARRAGLLSKCDLLTEMVGEFPELQGRMGCEYARRDGEPEAVAAAIGEVYMPRFADDAIPATPAGRAVAIADKLDTLAGIFGIGQAPSGDKDPYALRRAALGVLRIIIEAGLDLDLDEMIEAAFEGYAGQASRMQDSVAETGAKTAESAGGQATEAHEGTARDTGSDNGTTTGQALSAQGSMAESGSGAAEPAGGQTPGAHGDMGREDRPGRSTAPTVTHPPGGVAEVRRFMIERLRAWFADRSIPADVFNAVLAKQPARPLDFAHRVRAVEAFRALPEAASLAAANKRIRNILRQAEQAGIGIPPVGSPLSRGGAGSPVGSPDPAFPASAGMTAKDMPSRGGAGTAGVADSLLREDAERSLAATLAEIEPHARGMLDAGEYTGALTSLAGLRDGVDAFFDTVKVIDEDEKLRGNRLALLARIGALFMETADISLLQPASE